MSYMNKNSIKNRDEVFVEDIMVKYCNLDGVFFNEVKGATVGDILKTLKEHHDQHVLIIDSLENEFAIKGMFSASDIIRKLDVKVDVSIDECSFIGLGSVLLSNLPR